MIFWYFILSHVYNAASYVGVKDYIPPYLDPTLSIEELTTGVSFASASSGFDPLTSLLSVSLSLSLSRTYKHTF